MLKPPHWKWEIYLYFFLSGIASAAYVTSAIARLFGPRYRPIVRTGRYLSVPLLLVSTLLLVTDLKRPDRFHHMLRIFKTRSPMSVGTWALGIMSVISTFSASQQLVVDGHVSRSSFVGRAIISIPSRTIELIGALAGFFVAGYTGTLLTATAAPLWGKARAFLAPIFIASASSTAIAAISLVLSLLNQGDEDTRNRLKRADSLALLIEVVLLALFHRALGPLSRFLIQGRLGPLYVMGLVGGIVAPLLIQAKSGFFGEKVTRASSITAGSLVLAGGLVLRYVMLIAGRASTQDQKAVIRYARWG